MRYIVEARSPNFPSLFAVGPKCMAEVTAFKAMRFSHDEAKACAQNEKRLRPSRSIFVIKVK